MEELLNKLIKKGWKPRGTDYNSYERGCFIYEIHTRDGVYSVGSYPVTDRELVSKESGLWQFVCENNLVPIMCTEEWIKHYYEDIDDDNLISGENIQPTTEYEYRLIESSLKNESELEDFLLSNIKVEGK